MDYKSTPDAELLAAIAKGDERAFRVLFDRYYAPLTIYAARILRDDDAATDVVQAFFVAFFEQSKTLEISNVRSFCFQSVHNRCLNEIKHNKVRTAYAERTLAAEAEHADDIEQRMYASELEARLFDAIEQLPAQCRRIFKMSRFDDLSNAEIAERLDLSKRTVETQISKALQSLRKWAWLSMWVVMWSLEA